MPGLDFIFTVSAAVRATGCRDKNGQSSQSRWSFQDFSLVLLRYQLLRWEGPKFRTLAVGTFISPSSDISCWDSIHNADSKESK